MFIHTVNQKKKQETWNGLKMLHRHNISVRSFILIGCVECDDSLPFSGASSIPLCYITFPFTLFH
jgi:hypothetical protein